MTLTTKEFREIFKKRGWRAKAEGSLHSLLEYQYDNGRIGRHIAKYVDYTDTQEVQIEFGYTWKPFDEAVKFIDEIAKNKRTPDSYMQYLGIKDQYFEVLHPEITSEMIEPFFELSKEWVYEQDVEMNLALYRSERTLEIPGGKWQVYHLAALALNHDIDILKMYQEELHAGKKGRFFPFVENDLSYIDNAVEYTTLLMKAK